MLGRILVEDRCQSNRGGGIKTYIEQIRAHWPAESSLELVGFNARWHNRRRLRAANESTPVQIRPLRRLFEKHRPPRDASRPAHLLYLAYRAAFALESRRGYVAAFQPNYMAAPTTVPLVATMHDLSVIEHPEWHSPSRVARWHRYLTGSLRRTTQWITVSEFTRDRMISLLRINPARITVIPEAARSFPVNGEMSADRPAWLPPRYFLSLGTLEPRKNIRVLLDAYASLPPSFRKETPLLLIGPAGWGGPAFWRSLVEHPVADEVLVTGFLPDADLAAAMAHATALLAASLYEGFGLPILEAMAACCPVACSDIAAFHEVGGSAVEFIPPQDVAQWAIVMRRAVEDSDWRNRLIAAGSQRAATFSWEIVAKSHAEIFARVVNSR